MNLSLSINAYNGAITDLLSKIEVLNFDFFHIDSRDDIGVFDLIKVVRSHSDKPIDLHLITPRPHFFLSMARQYDIERISLQYEHLRGFNPLEYSHLNVGLSIGTNTKIETVNLDLNDFKFVQVMSGIPGISGGIFNMENIKKLEWLKKHYPNIKIEIDGGVKTEIMPLLKDFDIEMIVSGSYVFRSNSWEKTIKKLKNKLTTAS